MDRQRRILAQVEGAKAPGWISRGELPRELREGAARRLGILGLVTACSFVTFFLLNLPLNIGAAVESGPRPFQLGASSFAVLISLGIFFLSRLRRADPGLLLKLGVAYQLLMAAAIGFLNHLAPWDTVVEHQGWSGIAVWIILFAVFIPNTPWRTLWVSCSVALLDPLTLLASAALGNPLPGAAMLPLIFGPTLIAVATAMVAVRINVRLGKRLHDVQAMGSYQLVELLGRGGMGEVWRAEHKMLARPAAIKLIRPEALAGEGAAADNLLRRFEREAQATARLQSAHTIELYDFGVATDGAFYYVMELLDGLDQELLVQRHGPLPPARAIYMLRQVCESLAEAHERGLIHRDIKPSNIYVCRQGLRHDHVKLLDFGLVTAAPGERGDQATKLTVDGSMTGTPAYMVPEIIDSSDNVDGRADLYAVGCVAYWLLSGKLVFEAKSAMKMVVSHASEEPPRLSERAEQAIPPALEALVHACLEKDPARRPQSARALSERLAELASELAPEEAWDQERARAWWDQHLGATAVPAPASVETDDTMEVDDTVAVDPMAGTAAE